MGQDSSINTTTKVKHNASSVKSDATEDRSKLSPVTPKTSSDSKASTPTPSLSSQSTGSGTPADTATPQPMPIAGAGQGLQSAVPDNRGGKIIYKVTRPANKTLTNLLP